MDQLKQNMILEEELYWEIKEDIPHEKSESFVDYLQKEKEKFDRPQSWRQKIFPLIISIILSLTGLSSLAFSIDVISSVFLGTFESPEAFSNVPFEVSAGLEISIGFATSLGISFSVITILYRSFLCRPNWSSYHDQMLSLFKRLENVGSIENFITFDEVNRKKRFQLKKISTDIDLEWIYPFIFDDFPPLLFEFLLLSFLLPFFVSTIISLFFAILDMSWFLILFLSSLLLLILIGFQQSGLSIFRSWKKYHNILNSVIYKQQEIIHSLILNKSDEITIIRHQNNFNRLISMSSYPIPQLIRVSAIIPLFGSLLGYVIAIAAIT
ncbi:MAG: hypothetical protein JSW11_15200 [Candidatus Heimdallarchaeota archaeon]|nr:MAG: hypothetical protein JSW11_15200 [Candidatus Heimdallarchaeota archaeon]